MMKKLMNKGFGAVEWLLVVVVLLLLGFGTYYVIDQNSDDLVAEKTNSEATQQDTNEVTENEEETSVIPEGWVEYRNEDYGIAFHHPPVDEEISSGIGEVFHDMPTDGDGGVEVGYITYAPIKNAAIFSVTIYQKDTDRLVDYYLGQEAYSLLENTSGKFDNSKVYELIREDEEETYKLFALNNTEYTFLIIGESSDPVDDTQEDINKIIETLSVK